MRLILLKALPFILFSILPGLSVAVSSAEGEPFAVIIDPGHGGSDSGATRGHLREADIVLSVGRILKGLIAARTNFRVFLTRNSDKTMSLEERAASVGKDIKRGLFLSLHVNASENPTAHGVEFYFQNQLPPDEESQFLANRENQMSGEASERRELKESSRLPDVMAIIDDFSRNYRILQSAFLGEDLVSQWNGPIKLRTVPLRQGPFYLVNHLEVPSVLVEIGFVSNREEARKLSQSSVRKDQAENLYQGIIKYKERLDKGP